MKGKIRRISRHPETVLALSMIGLVMLLIVPLPPIILDGLLSINIVLSVMTLLLTLYIENALEFSAFPSLLLVMTLFRLGLNIASTRMILLDAEAGDIINTFGGFVTKNNPLVGLILFFLLTLINFIVVTKGASRIAEVAARFTLEALPGKQMSVDADLNAKSISFEEAKKRRRKITEESEFYGTMDGASKFVKGDAVAGLAITFVNILGGLIIGVSVMHLSFAESVDIFTRLTVGDGLVSQIPALLISIAAGMMVTRASHGSLGQTLPKQIFYNSRVLFISSGLLLFLAFLPGMPKKVMIPLAALLGIAAWIKSKEVKEPEEVKKKSEEGEEIAGDVEKALQIHPLEVELGLDLLPLADMLFTEMKGLRSRVAKKLGILVPSIRITDSLEIDSSAYQFKIKGVGIFCGKLDKDEEKIASLISILEEQIEGHAHELLNRQEVARLVENAKVYDSAVVEELIPKKISLGILLKVLQNLLKESIAIRDIVSILEILADHIPENSKELHPDELSEYVRKGLFRGITESIIGKSDIVFAITIDSKVEQMITAAVKKGDLETHLLLRPTTSVKITSALMRLTKAAKEKGITPVVLTQSSSRLHLRRIIEKHLPSLPILSYNEITEDKTIKAVGKVTTDVLL